MAGVATTVLGPSNGGLEDIDNQEFSEKQRCRSSGRNMEGENRGRNSRYGGMDIRTLPLRN